MKKNRVGRNQRVIPETPTRHPMVSSNSELSVDPEECLGIKE